MTCIIVDDEYRGREVLASLLRTYCPEIAIAGVAANVAEAYDTISRLRPDIVFLDIEMPDGSGFDLLKKFQAREFRTIFVTSYDHYAIQALRSRAFDYLLKPVIVDELKAAVKRVMDEQGGAASKTEDQDPVLEINHKTRLDYVRLDEILMLKGDGNYTFIHTTHGNTFHTSRILKEYEEILCYQGSDFVRTHKSFIINLRFASSFEHGAVRGLALANGTIVEVSRRKREEVIARLRMYRARKAILKDPSG